MPDPHSPSPDGAGTPGDRPGDDLTDRVKPFIGRLGDDALPARSFDDLTVPGTSPATGTALGGRRLRAVAAVAAALAVLIGIFALTTRDDADDRLTAGPLEETDDGDGSGTDDGEDPTGGDAGSGDDDPGTGTPPDQGDAGGPTAVRMSSRIGRRSRGPSGRRRTATNG